MAAIALASITLLIVTQRKESAAEIELQKIVREYGFVGTGGGTSSNGDGSYKTFSRHFDAPALSDSEIDRILHSLKVASPSSNLESIFYDDRGQMYSAKPSGRSAQYFVITLPDGTDSQGIIQVVISANDYGTLSPDGVARAHLSVKYDRPRSLWDWLKSKFAPP